jgi:hypothetical protein
MSVSYTHRVLESDLQRWVRAGWKFYDWDCVISVPERIAVISYVPVNGESWPRPEEGSERAS